MHIPERHSDVRHYIYSIYTCIYTYMLRQAINKKGMDRCVVLLNVQVKVFVKDYNVQSIKSNSVCKCEP